MYFGGFGAACATGFGNILGQILTMNWFYWKKIGSTSYELHEDYHDVNGEFISQFEYNAKEDALYMFGSLYAIRDDSFVLQK